MATFAWKPVGLIADWGQQSAWTGTGGAIPPPGSESSATDIAIFGTGNAKTETNSSAVVSPNEKFDVATLDFRNLLGEALMVVGTLLTNTVDSTAGGFLIDVAAGGFLDIRNGISASNTVSLFGRSLDTFIIDTGGHLELGSATTSGVDINDPNARFDMRGNFSGNFRLFSTGEIEFNGPTFTIGTTTNQFIDAAAGNKFVFDHANFTGDNVSYAGGRLTVTDAHNNIVLTMNNVFLAAQGLIASFQASGDTIEAELGVGVACYATGTHILTPSGEVPIETLAIGNSVVIRSGEARPIKWIGRRSYQGRFIAGNRDVLPIRISAGALADSIPKRDLDVSPGHAMFLDGVLVPVENLINGITIRQIEDVDSVEYIHLELDTHDVIFAEGALAETYVECDNRNKFQNGHEFSELYPGVDAPKWAYCAPWVDDGEVLGQVRRKLDERLDTLGFGKSLDPVLRLLVDGCEAQPDVVEGSTYLFRLTKRPAAVHILSRTSIPPPVGAGNDTRQLGVNLSSLVLRSDAMTIKVEHTHPLLVDGFHEAEAAHRWTNGNARIPPALLACFGDELIIEVRLLDKGLVYRIEPQAFSEPDERAPSTRTCSTRAASYRPPSSSAVCSPA